MSSSRISVSTSHFIYISNITRTKTRIYHNRRTWVFGLKSKNYPEWALILKKSKKKHQPLAVQNRLNRWGVFKKSG